MKKLLTSLMGAAVLLVLTGCAYLTEGYIIDKKYEEAYTYTTIECQLWDWVITGHDEDGYPIQRRQCVYYGPEENYVPPKWYFTIEGYIEGQKDKTKDTFQVDETTYNQYEVGDYYDRTPEDGSHAPGTHP